MEKSRTYNSVKNVIFSIGTYIITLILEFVSRTIFIHLLTEEYLGLNGLFANILSFLSLAELGVGTAMSYALYKPLKENDTEVVKSIMYLYRKLYCIIGFIVLAVGFMLTPFLPHLIKEMPENMPYLYLYYILYVLNSGISYFYTYKRSIIICDQKEYISTISTTIAGISRLLLQIIVLLVTKSYSLYLVVMILTTLGENIVISTIAGKQYPYLKERNVDALSSEITTTIKKNVFAMLFHKIGTAVVSATDNIIISKFVGLVALGVYSNYVLIVNAVTNLLNKIFTSLTASIGNLALADDKEHVEKVFYRTLFMNIWSRGFCAICLLCLLQPFINLWLGNRFLLTNATLIIIVINFYLKGVRSTVLTFRDATGIFWYDRYKPLIESVCNLVFSIPLAIKYGISGVLLGTILSTILVPLWVEPYVLFKYYFKKGIGQYMACQCKYAIVIIIIACMNYKICSVLPMAGIGIFILKLLICIIVPNVCMILLWHKKEEYQYYYHLVLKVLGKAK
ncbi:MAG: oligosaccharide flippase family protein [Lachnospiraceae bacterium]|nr:oligosaccharide flippase family protein [Lachnospiraceae bacterium]